MSARDALNMFAWQSCAEKAEAELALVYERSQAEIDDWRASALRNKKELDAAKSLLARVFGAKNCFDCHCRAYSTIYGHLICTFGGKETPDEGRRPDCPYVIYLEKK